MTIQQILIMACVALLVGMIISLLSVLAGAWVMSRGVRMQNPGQSMFKDPKGEVFTIPFDSEQTTKPEEMDRETEKEIKKRSARFLNVFGGGA